MLTAASWRVGLVTTTMMLKPMPLPGVFRNYSNYTLILASPALHVYGVYAWCVSQRHIKSSHITCPRLTRIDSRVEAADTH